MSVVFTKKHLSDKYKLQQVEFQQVQNELQILKSQVNPHFFFNTLNSLYALALRKSDELPEVILQLSDIMRYAFTTSSKKTVPLINEIAFIENYIKLEKLRIDSDSDIKVNVSGDFKNSEIIPMLYVVFVENSFKHGVDANSNKFSLKVNFKITGNKVLFDCTNSKAYTQIGKSETTCTGLANVRKRLKLSYPEKHKLIIKESENTYSVKLEIFD